MLRFVIRKMLHNKWMVACLLIGSVLAVSMVASVPMYTEGVLQRMLIKDLERYQVDNKIHAGNMQMTANVYYLKDENRLPSYMQEDELFDKTSQSLPVPVLAKYRQLVVDYMYGWPPGVPRDTEDVKRTYIKLSGLKQYEEKLKVIHGRFPAKEPVDGVYEVMITPAMMKRQEIFLDAEYEMQDMAKRREVNFIIKVVGVCEPKDLTDPFWAGGTARLSDGAIMDYDLIMRDLILGDHTMLINAYWNDVMDYHQLKLEDLSQMVSALAGQDARIQETSGYTSSIPALETLKTYRVRETQLKLTLWVLQAPILMMLAFYLFMVAQLIVDYERNEIAVLKSRGASRHQVVYGYFLESLFISVVALGVGPFIAVVLCRLIGASNGFLEFVQRAALPVRIGTNAIIYSVGAMVFSVLAMLVPALISARRTIVEHKRKRPPGRRAMLIKLAGGAVLIALALYARYTYNLRQEALLISGVDALVVPVDPLLFIMSTLFILGAGLILMAVHPLFVRLVFVIGKRIWSPALYASFIQVSRSGGQAQFVMLFLILTLAVGIFSANAARTININTQERIEYRNGSDMVITSQWTDDAPKDNMGMPLPQDDPLMSNRRISYKEPDFFAYQSVHGVQNAARVFTTEESMVSTPGRGKSIRTKYMAFFPWEFGRVAWSRHNLLAYPIQEYLNVLTNTPNAVFLSSNLKTELEVDVGDILYISWSQQQMVVQIAGFVEYWPSLSPFTVEKVGGVETPVRQSFVIGNMRYLNARMSLEPYQVWASLNEEVPTAEIYQDIQDRKLMVTKVQDSRQELIAAKNDPTLMGLNGALTMGFAVTMVISAIGFMIYWILSIKARVLQMGILRAMGMRLREIIAMLGCEQILISFLSILAGVVVGGITSDLFIPMLEVAFSASQRVPPFRVIMLRQDYFSIYGIVAVMLLIGFLVLGVLISRIRITQALKLGED